MNPPQLKTFVCRDCGATLRRPSAPLRCEACGAQRVGLFRLQPADAPSAASASPAPPSPKPVPVRAAPAAPAPPPPRVQRTPAPAVGPGSIAWRYPQVVPGDPLRQPLRNSPAIDAQGRIYAALGSSLACLRPSGSSIELAWEYRTGGHIPGPAVLGADGVVRVHSGDGRLHGVDERGAAAWSPPAVGEPLGWAAPIVDNSGNTWLCADVGGLVRVDARGTRDVRPYFRTRQRFDSTGLLRQGVLYVGAEDAFIYAIAPSASGGKNTWDHLAGCGKTAWFVNSAPAPGPDGTIVVAGRDEFLYFFATDGRLSSKVHIRGQMLGSPIVDADGNVYVGVSLLQRGRRPAGKLVCVDGAAGHIAWEYETPGPVESTPVLAADGILYFGDNGGTVHAIDRSGNRQWSSPVGAAVRSAGTLCGPEHVLFGLDDGTLVALLCKSRELASAGWPKLLATLSQSAPS
ncbi:MAG TPA: PQQ-binding-like beta-propeller repeat protein [Pirellulales bacterium]|nr:PQQ-binding-like beta-propeller repeat protein [Pirellulales bacterium]